MSLSGDLIEHAADLLTQHERSNKQETLLRRAVSAAYYALYHHLTMGAVLRIAPTVSTDVQHRIGRWFEHAEMKKVCGRFAKAKLDQPLRDLIGESASDPLQDIANTFIKLQEARHAADYDLSYQFSFEEAVDYVQLCTRAMKYWLMISSSAEANIFILSLLMWKNWERERL